MMNTLWNFYLIHQNIFVLVVLLFLLFVFFIAKQNFKAAIPTIIVFVGINLFCYNQTKDMAWERQFLVSDEYPTTFLFDKFAEKDSIKMVQFKDSMKVEFSAKKDWVVFSYDSTGKARTHHWCWVDQKWEVFSQTDLVSAIWGENAGKKVRGASEKRLSGEAQ